MSEKCPEWKYEIPRSTYVKLLTDPVTKIIHHWKFTSEDSSEHWYELHFEKGKMRAPANLLEYFTLDPDHKGLLRAKLNISRMWKDHEEIEKWIEKNKRELATYKRLKAKFEGVKDD